LTDELKTVYSERLRLSIHNNTVQVQLCPILPIRIIDSLVEEVEEKEIIMPVWCKNSIRCQKPEMKAVCGNRG
jgi:hypothetical protein